MDQLDTILNVLKEWLNAMLTGTGLLQLVVVAVSIILAWVSHRRWLSFIHRKLGEQERPGIRRFAIRSTVRVVLPSVMLLFIVIGQGILNQYQIRTQLLNLLIPLIGSLVIIRIVVYSLRRAFTPSAALKAWEGIISSLVWVVVALHLLGWLPDVLSALDDLSISIGKARVSVLSSMQFVIAAGIFIVLAHWISHVIERRTRRSKYISASMQIGLTKFSKVLLYTVAILIALNSVGIDLTTLTVFGGALGVGLGFGLQRIASNFISGFILLFDRSIKPGDVISIGERFGWVVALHGRYVVVRDRDGVEALIPNETLITSEVTNWSYTDRHVRLKIPVQISYDNDPEFAMKLMLDVSGSSDRILQDPEPQVRMLGFGDNGVNLELRVWIDDPEMGTGSVRSDINLAIWKAFKENNITIPFPQRVVTIKYQ